MCENIAGAMEYLDTVSFIQEVKKRPSLWDSSTDDYKNRELKRDEWKKICKIVVPEFREKSERKRQEIAKAVQLKWKHLRDSFVRHVRQFKKKKSGATAKPTKTYIYAKQLQFLRKVSDFRRTESSLPSTSKESQDDCNLSQDHNETQDTQLDVGNDTPVERTPNKSLFRRKRSTLENKLINYIDSFTKQPPVIQDQPKETDDLVFFRSLQTSLDTLSPNEKLNFRIDVMQLLTRYTNKQPNGYTHNFPNFTSHNQSQEYPVMANYSNTRLNTPMPSSSSYPTESPGLTFLISNTEIYNNKSERVISPKTPCSQTESVDSILSKAESII